LSYRYDALGGAIKYGQREGAREGRRRERGVGGTSWEYWKARTRNKAAT
jgi:hypothetical protein